MKLNHILFLSFILFVLSCSTMSPSVTGTGHEGEARVVGIAATSAGDLFKNSELFVAAPDYTPKTTRSGEPFGGVVVTDSTGKFELTLPLGYNFILSSKNCGEYIYLPFATDAKSIDFGTVYHEEGETVAFTPSVNSDTLFTTVAVQGTNWQFDLRSDYTTTVLLPEGDLTLVRNGVSVYTGENLQDTIYTEVSGSGTSIGSSNISNVKPVTYFLDDTGYYGIPAVLDIPYDLLWDSVHVYWGEPLFDDTAMSVLYCDTTLLGTSTEALWKYEYQGDSSRVYYVTIHQFAQNDSLIILDSILMLDDYL